MPHFLHVFQCLIVSKHTTERRCCVRYEILSLNSPQNKSFVLFKWRVVLVKTTCCFNEYDVLFGWKRRVVLVKTTCCFSKNDVWFSMKGRKREKICPRNRNREQRIRIVKTSITPFFHAHAYTRITGVFAFLLSQVSQDYLQYAVNQISMVLFRQILTNMGFKGGKHTDNGSQKSFLSLFRPPKIVWFFPQNFPLCDTCDSKKSTSLLEGARIRAYVRQKNTKKRHFVNFTTQNKGSEKYFVTFSLIFPSLGAYRPIYQ